MKSFTRYLEFNTSKRIEIVHITPEVEKIVKESKIKEGFALVSSMHVTSAVIVNENDPNLHSDFLAVLERLAPFKASYKHNVSDDNAAAHIWRHLLGNQALLPITNGKLELGVWGQVFYCEFDGQRKKRVLVKVIGE